MSYKVYASEAYVNEEEEKLNKEIEKRPIAYDTRKTAPLTIEVGDLTKLECKELDETTMWKCSNYAPAKEEFIGAMVTTEMDGVTTETTITQEMLSEEDSLPVFSVWVDEELVSFVVLQDTALYEVPLSAGIWIINPDIRSFYLPSVTTGELKTIDPKFLPSGGGMPVVEIELLSLHDGGESMSETDKTALYNAITNEEPFVLKTKYPSIDEGGNILDNYTSMQQVINPFNVADYMGVCDLTILRTDCVGLKYYIAVAEGQFLIGRQGE